MSAFSVNIEEVVDYLGLERNPKGRSGASSFDVKCPFCNDKGYHLNINTVKNTYHCVKCMDSTRKNTGVLDLYGRVALGTPLSGDNSKTLFKSLMKELGRTDKNYTPVKYEKNHAEAETYKEITPASDEKLDKVYTALLSLPYLELCQKHRDNLRSRGLTDEEIEANGYASMTAPKPLLVLIESLDYGEDKISEIKKFYKKNKISKIKEEKYHFKKQSDEGIILGMKIAVDVIRATGMYPDGVPGFFKLKGKWGFRSVDCGILIPTRNAKGQIVGLQTRRDIKAGNGPRYMTVSSKGLDSGVTTAIARAHFPKGQTITADTTVVLTEGPLKSDTALSLLHQLGIENVAFIALQGVNSTRELPVIAKSLREMGIHEIKDGFDIDKLVNPSVFKSLKSAQRIFSDNGGIKLTPLFWDREYAELKMAQMEELCQKYHLEWEKTGRLYADLVSLSALFDLKNIDYNFIKVNGLRKKEKWNDKTKGIDDYLLSMLETTKAAAEL